MRCSWIRSSSDWPTIASSSEPRNEVQTSTLSSARNAAVPSRLATHFSTAARSVLLIRIGARCLPVSSLSSSRRAGFTVPLAGVASCSSSFGVGVRSGSVRDGVLTASRSARIGVTTVPSVRSAGLTSRASSSVPKTTSKSRT